MITGAETLVDQVRVGFFEASRYMVFHTCKNNYTSIISPSYNISDIMTV